MQQSHVTTPSASGRRDILSIGIAYSQLVRNDTALVVDLVHGAKSESGANETIMDVGLRHVIGDDWALPARWAPGLASNHPASG